MAKTKAQLEEELAALKAKGNTKPKGTTTRTVKLPPMVKLAGVGIQVDPTYPRNLAVHSLTKDGEVATKRDGTIKKPKRIPVTAVRGMLENPEQFLKLCEASEAMHAEVAA